MNLVSHIGSIPIGRTRDFISDYAYEKKSAKRQKNSARMLNIFEDSEFMYTKQFFIINELLKL